MATAISLLTVDHVVTRTFFERCELAFPRHLGPFLVPKAGHFLQWDRPNALVSALIMLFRDKL